MKKTIFLGVMLSGIYLASCKTENVAAVSDTANNSSARILASDSAGKHGKHRRDSLHVHSDSLHKHRDSTHVHKDSTHTHAPKDTTGTKPPKGKKGKKG